MTGCVYERPRRELRYVNRPRRITQPAGLMGRFVPMQFRFRERNDHTVNVPTRQRTCRRFVFVLIAYSTMRARSDSNVRVHL